MTKTRKFLCAIGLHKWAYLYIGHWNGFTQETASECLHCRKRDNTIYISPLSGPISGPMHPRIKESA
jgi:hypothetical protein